MKFLKIIFKRETVAPMLALMFASAVSVGLVFTRIIWTKHFHYGFLVWNLALAWMPLCFALLARETYRTAGQRTWRFYGLAGAWLLFFPNAPYIFTDLIHLTTRFRPHFWIDMTLISLCAVTGLVLGFVSLYLMQSVVARMFGRVAGWIFVAMTAGLSSFGIYLGRFLRLNSWDVVLRPGKIYNGIDAWADGRMVNGSSAAFLVFFAAFLFIAYVMLYALTHLPRAQEMHLDLGGGKFGEA